MAKIIASSNRLFKNVFVCRRCGTKMRATPKKIIDGKVKCRRCLGKAFKPKSKK